MADAGETILEVRDLNKSFYGVAANDHVNFDLRSGEVHGLLGENGAGKSTLCSVLAGLYRPDSGEISIDGQPVSLRSPHDAAEHGIGMVYQHFRLVPSLTVAENLVLGLKDQGIRLTLRAVETRVAGIAEEYGLSVHPGAYIWQLSVGEQQRVEILKQLFRGARILILDEPTAVLAPQECEKLFEVVRHMAGQGHSVVLVSHKMEEILGHTDRVTVLRGGRNAGTVDTAEATASQLATMMIGAEHMPEAGQHEPRRFDDAEAVLTVADLHVTGDRGTAAVNGASLEVRSGQIVGIAGVAGNGQREFQEALAGLRGIKAGSVRLRDRDITSASPRQRSQAGLAYVPEDRLGTGLASGLTIEENLVLKSYRERPTAGSGFCRRALSPRRPGRWSSASMCAAPADRWRSASCRAATCKRPSWLGSSPGPTTCCWPRRQPGASTLPPPPRCAATSGPRPSTAGGSCCSRRIWPRSPSWPTRSSSWQGAASSARTHLRPSTSKNSGC